MVVVALARTIPTMVQVIKEQIIIPDATIVEGAAVGGIPHPGLLGDPNRETAQDKSIEVSPDSQGWAQAKTQSIAAGGMGDASAETADSMIGLGVGGTRGRIGTGDGSGIGSSEGSQLAMFGVPGGGGGAGPRSQFLGVSGNATRVAYVCDASGSMLSKFERLRSELRQAVDTLVPIQQFSVVFFQDNQAICVDKTLLFATPQNKRRAYDFLDRTGPRADSDVIPHLSWRSIRSLS